MPKLTLIYFDFAGGRGEAQRLIMHLGGLAFEDQRIPGAQWGELRDQMPFQALPVLEVDGRMIAQSNTLNRYLGKLAGLYPKDDLQAALVDEVMDAVEDASALLAATMQMDEDAKKQARETLAAGKIPRYLEQLNARLEAGGGEYFVENRLTVADIKVYLWIRWLRSGALDHLPADIADRHAPLLVQHFDRVREHPGITAYYAARKTA